uniref:SHSP domain-containing protein n=2 Tax=Triticum TaxID=4564 RepID=A0A8R7P9W6_TRIUA
MDLDLALQETRPAVAGEDFAFTTTETDDAFLVLAHLPGYDKDAIEVRVGDGGREIRVDVAARKDGAGLAVEAARAGTRLRVAHRRAVEGFRRVFDVPAGVDVGRVSVGFEEDDELLVIILPKLRQPQASPPDDEARVDVESTDDYECASSDGTEVELDDGWSSASLELEQEEWVDV